MGKIFLVSDDADIFSSNIFNILWVLKKLVTRWTSYWGKYALNREVDCPDVSLVIVVHTQKKFTVHTCATDKLRNRTRNAASFVAPDACTVCSVRSLRRRRR